MPVAGVLTSNIRVVAGWTFNKTPANQLTVGQYTDTEDKKTSFTDGLGADKADTLLKIEGKTIVGLAGPNSDSYDLVAALEDYYGDLNQFAKIKGIVVFNTTADLSAGDLFDIQLDVYTDAMKPGSGKSPPMVVVTATAGDVLTAHIPIQAKGVFAMSFPQAGVSLIGGTSDVIKITNPRTVSGEDVQYDLLILGERVPLA